MHKNAQKTTFQSTATAAQKRPLWEQLGGHYGFHGLKLKRGPKKQCTIAHY